MSSCSSWVRQGVLDGLRVDHPDGLRNPQEYCRAAPRAGTRELDRRREDPRAGRGSFPTTGPSPARSDTTSSTSVNGLLIDAAGEAPLTDLFTRFTGVPADYAAMVRDKKHLVLKELFGSDLARLTSLMMNICERQKRYRDYTRRELTRHAPRGDRLLPGLPDVRRGRSGADRRRATAARSTRRSRRPSGTGPRSTSTSSISSATCSSSASRGSWSRSWSMRFQQLTGPVMAKGVEDTVFYNYNRLVALNEVGGDPGRFGVAARRVPCRVCRPAQARWPRRDARLDHARHQAERGRPRAARAAVGDSRSAGPARSSAGRRQRAAPTRRHARSQPRIPPLPDAGRRLADRRRAAGRLSHQGLPRSEGIHLVDSPRTRFTRRRSPDSPGRSCADAVFLDDLRGLHRPARRAGAGQLAVRRPSSS